MPSEDDEISMYVVYSIGFEVFGGAQIASEGIIVGIIRIKVGIIVGLIGIIVDLMVGMIVCIIHIIVGTIVGMIGIMQV